MALNISAWSIRNPLPSVVCSIILVVLGWLSFTRLAVTHLPSADTAHAFASSATGNVFVVSEPPLALRSVASCDRTLRTMAESPAASGTAAR